MTLCILSRVSCPATAQPRVSTLGPSQGDAVWTLKYDILTLEHMTPYNQVVRRMTFSLSDETGSLVELLAGRVANGNSSVVAEVALKWLIEQPFPETQNLVEFELLDRMTASRSGWMRAFWQALGKLLNQPDRIRNVRAPRQYEGFFAVLLLHNVGREDDEHDPFHPHVGPAPVLPDSPAPQTWDFPRSHSPVAAARTVASKLREYGIPISSRGKE